MPTRSSKAQQLAVAINKMLGADAVRMGSEKGFKVTYTSTGSLPFDIAFGGGIPRGRFVEIHGDFSTLKTYIGLCALREVQRAGGIAALIDLEHTYDPDWAERIGVNVDDLMLKQPETGEQAIDVMEVMIRNGANLIVFDSVAAALPQSEQGKRLSKETVQPGRQAALMSLACRKLTAANVDTSVIWINQLREQIGMTFGPTEKGPGGRALGYYASIRLNVRKSGKLTIDRQIHDGEKFKNIKHQVGQLYTAIVEKSKISEPYRQVFFAWSLTDGMVDEAKFLFAQGAELGLVKQKGTSRWQYGELVVNGRERFIQMIRDDANLAMDLEAMVRNHYGLPGNPAHLKRPAAATKQRSSNSKVAARTRAVGRGASGTTAARKTSSSKSSTRRRHIR